MEPPMGSLLLIDYTHVFCDDNYFCHCRACSKQRYNRDLALWRRRWAEAKAAEDYDEMDRLDRQFQIVGLP